MSLNHKKLEVKKSRTIRCWMLNDKARFGTDFAKSSLQLA